MSSAGLAGVWDGVVGRTVRRLAPIAAAVCIAATGGACSGQSGQSGQSPSGPSSTALRTQLPAVTGGPSAQATVDGPPQLAALADGVEGDVGLWTYRDGGGWTAATKVPGATAIARDGTSLVLAQRTSIELRDVARPRDPGSTISVKWAAPPPQGSVACVDRSDSGKTVVAVADAGGFVFGLVSADGAGGPLTPAPTSPFGPSVAWLGTDRLVALSTDNRQVSRLAVIDTAKRSTTLLQRLGGVRVFGVSPDRSTLAVATETGVYVGSVSDWIAEKDFAPIVVLDPMEVVWDLALSGDGSRVAMLSGTEAADGTVADIHEIAYERQAGAWKRIFI